MKTNKPYIDLNDFKKTPFEVPEGYFEQLKKDMFGQTSGETMIPASFSKAHPFLVEEAYFDNLGISIHHRINETKASAKTAKMRPLYWSAAAAMLVGGIFLFQPRQAENTNTISHRDIAEYLVEEEDMYPFADDALAIVAPNSNTINPYVEVTSTVAVEELNDLSE